MLSYFFFVYLALNVDKMLVSAFRFSNQVVLQHKVEETWIDGIRYYSQRDNKLLEERDAELRSNIIQKILSTKGPSTFSSSKKSSSMHNGHKCDILDNTGVYDD